MEIDAGSAQILEQASGAVSPCFVDCGFNEGVVLGGFMKRLSHFSFYGYEAQPTLYECVKRKFPNASLANSGVGTDYGEGIVTVGKPDYAFNVHGGAQVVTAESPGSRETVLSRIPVVDFAEELWKIRSKHDFIAVKMDIEGAEYDVLERCLGLDERPFDFLACEFHPKKVSVSRHRNVMAALERSEISVTKWA